MTLPFGGVDWVTIQKALQDWVVAGSGLSDGSVYWTGQDSPRVREPAISMKIYTALDASPPWLDRETVVLSVPSRTVVPDATLDTLTAAAHALVTGDGPVRLTTTGTIPGGLQLLKDYWVVVIDASTLKLSATFNGTGGNFVGNPITTVDITSAGTGTLTLSGNGQTVRAGQEILYVARSMERMTLNLECHTSAAVGMGMAMAVLHNVKARRPLLSQQAILLAANIGVESVEHVRAVHGIRNAVMFEPRAIMQVHLSVPSEASEAGTIIKVVKGENLITSTTFQVPDPAG